MTEWTRCDPPSTTAEVIEAIVADVNQYCAFDNRGALGDFGPGRIRARFERGELGPGSLDVGRLEFERCGAVIRPVR